MFAPCSKIYFFACKHRFNYFSLISKKYSLLKNLNHLQNIFPCKLLTNFYKVIFLKTKVLGNLISKNLNLNTFLFFLNIRLTVFLEIHSNPFHQFFFFLNLGYLCTSLDNQCHNH